MNALPDGFAALEPFAARWAGETAGDRDRLRSESSDADRAAFYAAGVDLLGPALELLDRKPLAELDARERRLMNLVLCLAHVAIAVEIQRDIEEQRAPYRSQLRITRASSDR